jgi:hypothetical protein
MESTGETPDPAGGNGVTPDPSSSGSTVTATVDVDGLKTALHQERQAAKQTKRELAAMQERLATFEDRDKTELEKAAARADAAERELSEFRTRETARSIATEAGVPDMWDMLHGDEDNMKALAKRLAEKVANASPPPPGDLGAGVRSSGTGLTGSKAMTEQIRRAAGRR